MALVREGYLFEVLSVRTFPPKVAGQEGQTISAFSIIDLDLGTIECKFWGRVEFPPKMGRIRITVKKVVPDTYLGSGICWQVSEVVPLGGVLGDAGNGSKQPAVAPEGSKAR